MRTCRPIRNLALWTACACASACSAGSQSALHPAGRDAERISGLFTIMAIGAGVIWASVMAAALYASIARADASQSERAARRFIVAGGVVLPTITLTALLIVGLGMLPDLLDLGPDEQPAVAVSAEQWWWRVHYRLDDGSTVALANELRLPVGRRVAIALDSPDVVHSFWVPALAGKVDAIPGRVTHLGIEPTRAGVYRGACAEYCGLSHAKMTFYAVVMAPDDYAAWLDHQAAPARPPQSDLARRGQQAFMRYGCPACHAIRGTAADGAVGPDLTHVGSRLSIGGVIDNDVDGFRRWLTDPEHVKPGVHMPAFDMVPAEEVTALATYLDELE